MREVAVVDVACSATVTADPDSHTRACALKCAPSGFRILIPDQYFVKFDAQGNKRIADALKASDNQDHLRVDVSGDLKGDTLTTLHRSNGCDPTFPAGGPSTHLQTNT